MLATCPCKVRDTTKNLFMHSSLASVCKPAPECCLCTSVNPDREQHNFSLSACLFSQWLAWAHAGACCQPVSSGVHVSLTIHQQLLLLPCSFSCRGTRVSGAP